MPYMQAAGGDSSLKAYMAQNGSAPAAEPPTDRPTGNGNGTGNGKAAADAEPLGSEALGSEPEAGEARTSRRGVSFAADEQSREASISVNGGANGDANGDANGGAPPGSPPAVFKRQARIDETPLRAFLEPSSSLP